jgi:hypothetical protein
MLPVHACREGPSGQSQWFAATIIFVQTVNLSSLVRRGIMIIASWARRPKNHATALKTQLRHICKHVCISFDRHSDLTNI